MVIHDLTAAVAELVAALLSACAGRKVRNIEREVLAVDGSMHHEDVTGTEIVPLLLTLDPVYGAALESERNRFAFNEFEHLRLIEQSHVHSTSVRSVIVDDLIVRLCDLRLHHEVLEHESVLDLRHAEDGMPCTVILLHRPDDLGHVLKLLLIFRFSPLVLSLRKEFFVILYRIVVCIEEILKVVESHDIILCALLGLRAGAEKHQCRKYYCYSFHNFLYHHTEELAGSAASSFAACSSPTLAGRFTKKSIPVISSSSSMDIECDFDILPEYALCSR